MAKQWSVEELRAMPIHSRHELYKNACRLGHTETGAALKSLIEASGLPFSDAACLTDDDPITLKMTDVVFSKEGRDAAVQATAAGLPAMAGVDPLLQAALGVDYGAHNMGTATAGDIVGRLMRSLDYKKAGQKAMPPHCVAKTAAMWV